MASYAMKNGPEVKPVFEGSSLVYFLASLLIKLKCSQFPPSSVWVWEKCKKMLAQLTNMLQNHHCPSSCCYSWMLLQRTLKESAAPCWPKTVRSDYIKQVCVWVIPPSEDRWGAVCCLCAVGGENRSGLWKKGFPQSQFVPYLFAFFIFL